MKVPSEVPLMILPNATLFPQQVLPLRIYEPRYRRMLTDVLEGGRMFAIALAKPGIAKETPLLIGGLGLVSACVEQPDGTSLLTLQGLVRVQLQGAVRYKPYRIEAIQALASPPEDEPVENALVRKVRTLVRQRVNAGFDLGIPLPDDPAEAMHLLRVQQLADLSLKKFGRQVTTIKSPEQLADLVASTLLEDPYARQIILGAPLIEQRLQCLCELLLRAQSASHDDYS